MEFCLAIIETTPIGEGKGSELDSPWSIAIMFGQKKIEEFSALNG